jgi:hypothetical protein
MERRDFIRNTSFALAASLVPGALFAGIPSAGQMTSFAVPGLRGQIRHGLLELPVAGQALQALPANWLADIRHNVFFRNGFTATKGEQDLEVISLFLRKAGSAMEIPVQLLVGSDRLRILGASEKNADSGEWESLPETEGLYDFSLFSALEGAVHSFDLAATGCACLYLLEGKIKIGQEIISSGNALAVHDIANLNLQALENSRLICIRKLKD